MYLTLGTLNPVLCRWYIRVVIEEQARTNLCLSRSNYKLSSWLSGSLSEEILCLDLLATKDSSKKRFRIRSFLAYEFSNASIPGRNERIDDNQRSVFTTLAVASTLPSPIEKISSGLSGHTTMSRAIASSQINPFSGPRFSIDWKKKFASVLVRGRDLGGFEYDRFPINKDSRDNGARSSTWKERGRRGGGHGRGWASYL